MNIAVGYFINLVGDIIGGSVPPENDKSTLGSRGDLVAVVIGENEKLNPWKQSYAVEQGFKPTDSVVTAFSAYMGSNNIDHNSVKGQELLNTLAAGLAGAASGISGCMTQFGTGMIPTNSVKFAFLFLGPEHADTIYRDFPIKNTVSEYLVKKTVLPFWMYGPDRCKPTKEFGPYNADTPIPRFTAPEQVRIIVTGGPGKQSQIWPTFPSVAKPVSVLVEK